MSDVGRAVSRAIRALVWLDTPANAQDPRYAERTALVNRYVGVLLGAEARRYGASSTTHLIADIQAQLARPKTPEALEWLSQLWDEINLPLGNAH